MAERASIEPVGTRRMRVRLPCHASSCDRLRREGYKAALDCYDRPKLTGSNCRDLKLSLTLSQQPNPLSLGI